MDTILLILAILLVLVGFAGTVLPMLPGIPLIFSGFLVRALATGWQDISEKTIIILAVVTLVVSGIDYWAGIAGAKKYGASRAGIWGAILGGLVGLVMFNIVGIILGPFIGAVLGELFSGKSKGEAWKAGWGTFVGFLAGSFIRIVTGVVMTILFFYYLFF